MVCDVCVRARTCVSVANLGQEMHNNGLICFAAALALAVWWRPSWVRMPWSWQANKRVTHAAQGGSSYCPWVTFCHVVHLVKISMLLIDYSVSRGEVGGSVLWAWIRKVCVWMF